MLRDVTRLKAGSLLLDVTRLGNDNHSQFEAVKKPLSGLGLKWNASVYKINYILQ